MSISEFAVHNVLRTYSRQERLGGVHKAQAKSTGSPQSADRVNLSSAGRKIQWIGTLAAEMVDQQHPELGPEDRPALVRSTKEQLLAQHRDEIGADAVSPEALEGRLRPLYLD
jgi:hypothetical protein